MLGKNVTAVLTVCADSGRFLVQLQEELGRHEPSRTIRLGPWHEMVNAMCDERRPARLAWLSEESEPMRPQQLFGAIRDFLPADAVVVLDGIPFGMGAKLAVPGRMVIVICGDYGFGLSAMDLETAVRHRIPVIVVIANNDGITGSLRQKATFSPDYPELFSRFQRQIRYERIMEVFGGHGEFVLEAADIRPALERAAASGLPSCINVSVNPDTPNPGVW
jgi:thiamine pyrophosphate-dependent acetolactate synthase large subunit-like protein